MIETREIRDREKKQQWQTVALELIEARVADANSTIARSGCSRYKYLSRERAREGARASASCREGWSTSRNNNVYACVSAYAWIREVGEFFSWSRRKPSPVLERQKHLGQQRPACLRLSGEFVGKFVRLLPAFQSILRGNIYWEMEISVIFICINNYNITII